MGISSEKEPDWSDLLYFASLIPRVCHNINRICYVFGGPVEYPVNDVTQTNLTPNVIGTLRQVDFLANQVLHMANCAEKLSQTSSAAVNCLPSLFLLVLFGVVSRLLSSA